MKWIPLLLSVASAGLLVSCQKATPRETFDIAVLNCNLMHGFAGSGMRYELEHPSITMGGEHHDQQVAMMRAEVVDSKIQSLETAYEKVRKLSPDDDSREIVQASTALYEFVLPVLRNEYRKLAGLYDAGAAQKEIQALEQTIEKQYQAKFITLSDAVTAAGKPFAERHQIPVKWDIRTSPGG